MAFASSDYDWDRASKWVDLHDLRRAANRADITSIGFTQQRLKCFHRLVVPLHQYFLVLFPRWRGISVLQDGCKVFEVFGLAVPNEEEISPRSGTPRVRQLYAEPMKVEGTIVL